MMSKESKETLARLKDIPTKAELENLLTCYPVICKFTKLDGDERTMTLTHDLEMIPKENHPKGEYKPHEKNVTGWCADAGGWRSFRYDRLISIDLGMKAYMVSVLALKPYKTEIDKSIIASMTETLTQDEEKMLADDKIYAAEAGREPYTLAELKDLRLKFGNPCI
jgi:hypothetical protein